MSALDYTNAVTISGYTIPAISTRRADTQVELRDGQSFAISGLLDHRTTDIFNKMPGIGDVPILGQLFRSKTVNHSTVELMVIVTPTVIDPLNDTTSPTLPKLPVPSLEPEQFDQKTVKPKPETQSKPGTGGTRDAETTQCGCAYSGVADGTCRSRRPWSRSAKLHPDGLGTGSCGLRELLFGSQAFLPSPNGRSTPRPVSLWLTSTGSRAGARDGSIPTPELLPQHCDPGFFFHHRP